MNEVLDQLRSTFASTFGSTFNLYFKGQILVPMQSDLPILTVYPLSTEQTHTGTLRDSVTYIIAVQALVNVKTYLDSSSGQGTQLDSLDALLDLVEKRESDGDPQTSTIIGILNANLTIGDKVLYTDNVRVEYETLNAGEFPLLKATVTFEAEDRPNRT